MKTLCLNRSRLVLRDDGYGSEVVEDPWLAPREVPARLQAEARSALAAATEAARAAPKETVKRWLASLGLLCAGHTGADDAKLKIGGYAALLDFPPICYTRESLKAAAERFKWLPSFSELSEFLGQLARPVTELRDRLEAIATARTASPTAPPPPKRELTPEESAAIQADTERRLAELRAAAKRPIDLTRTGGRPIRNGPFDGLPAGQDPWGRIPGTAAEPVRNPSPGRYEGEGT